MPQEYEKDLLAKREEALQKIKQLEADIYFLQGYIKRLDEEIEEKKNDNSTPES